MKRLALVGSSLIISMGLITACGSAAAEPEAPAPTVTETVTSTVTSTAKASTITSTVTETATPEDLAQEVVEPAAVQEYSEPEVNTPQQFAAIPDPAPAVAPAPSRTYYANCAAVRAAGAAPIYAGSPGYSSKLDRDGDGIACE
ncbi:excalibur calcium-binding domain-containing protein [Corynebacterium glutamicum]|uniref:excalibur calcium-binding domain-containing protein n=1 Tax=Corynebacterium glutamicum TaxID=1718 RepID=UPI001B8C7735